MITDADRLRIIVALAALKYKPAEQSCASYALELEANFPTLAGNSRKDEWDDRKEALRWKMHALRLEKEIGDLKAKYEAEQIQAISLARVAEMHSSGVQPVSSGSQTQSSVTNANPSSCELLSTAGKNSAGGKKKAGKKKKAQQINSKEPNSRGLDLETLLEGHFNDASSQFFSSCAGTVFSAFSSFEQLVSVLPQHPTSREKSLLLSTTIRALHAVSASMTHILFESGTQTRDQLTLPQSGSATLPIFTSATTHTFRLQKLGVLLNHLFTTSIPLLCTSSATFRGLSSRTGPGLPSGSSETSGNNQAHPIDVLLDSLTTLVVRPLLHSFVPLSERLVHSLFEAKCSSTEPASSRRNFATSNATPATSIHPCSSASVYSNIRTQAFRVLHDLLFVLDGMLGTTGNSSSHSECLSDLPIFNRGSCNNSIGLGFKESVSLAVIRELLDVYDSRQFRIGFSLLEPARTKANTDVYPWTGPPSSSTLSESIGIHTTSTATDINSNRGDFDLSIPPTDIAPGTGHSYRGCGCSVHRRRRVCPNTESEECERLEATQQLARKDIVWYFCSVLHLLLPGDVRTAGDRMKVDIPDVTSASGGAGRHGGGASSTSNGLVGGAETSSSNIPSVTANDGRARGGEKGEADVDDVESGHDGNGIRLLREGVLEALLGLITRCQRRDASWGRHTGTEREYNPTGPLDVENEGGTAVRKDAGREKTGSERDPSVLKNLPKLFLEEEEYLMLLGVIERYYWLLSPIVPAQAPID